MEVVIPEELYESLTLITKYQNTLLLKEIAKEKNWKYAELKKEFLKDQDMEELLKKYKKKNIKKKKKKEVKNEENIELNVEDLNEPIVLEEPSIVSEPAEVTETEEVVEPPVKKKKKIKKIVKEKEIKCHKYIFDGEVFYVNVVNDNAYDKNMEFVGSKIGNGINFNAEEKEN
jgi:hypothetical protein